MDKPVIEMKIGIFPPPSDIAEWIKAFGESFINIMTALFNAIIVQTSCRKVQASGKKVQTSGKKSSNKC